MALGSSRRYEVELWSQSGSRVADISTLASNRRYTLRRNEAEVFTFTLDLFDFERYCAYHLGGTDPNVLIRSYVTDVKLKRDGQYLFGTQVVSVDFDLDVDQYKVTVTCVGYLNFFKDRYITKSYPDTTERTSIATDMILTTQGQTNGSFGVTIHADQHATGEKSERNYERDEIKQKIQQLAALSDTPFDFWFSYDKVFQTVGQLGARRHDIKLIYGGPMGNVTKFGYTQSGNGLYNKVYGLGSGFGTSQLQSTQGDNASQLNYYLRERIEQFNSVENQDTLDQNTASALHQAQELLLLPKVTLNGNDLQGTFINLGDRVPLQVREHKWLADINGLYRVEQIDVQIDDNDFESQIDLTFDNYGVDQDE